MDGSATFTTVRSRTIMSCAHRTTARVMFRRSRAGRAGRPAGLTGIASVRDWAAVAGLASATRVASRVAAGEWRIVGEDNLFPPSEGVRNKGLGATIPGRTGHEELCLYGGCLRFASQ